MGTESLSPVESICNEVYSKLVILRASDTDARRTSTSNDPLTSSAKVRANLLAAFPQRNSIRTLITRQTTGPTFPALSAPAPAPDAPSTIPPASPAPSLCLPRSHTPAPNSNTPVQIPAPPGSIPQNSSSPHPHAPCANKGCQDYSALPDMPDAPPALSAGAHTRARYRLIVRTPCPGRNSRPHPRDSKPARAPKFSSRRPSPSSAGKHSPDSATRPRGPDLSQAPSEKIRSPHPYFLPAPPVSPGCSMCSAESRDNPPPTEPRVRSTRAPLSVSAAPDKRCPARTAAPLRPDLPSRPAEKTPPPAPGIPAHKIQSQTRDNSYQPRKSRSLPRTEALAPFVPPPSSGSGQNPLPHDPVSARPDKSSQYSPAHQSEKPSAGPCPGAGQKAARTAGYTPQPIPAAHSQRETSTHPSPSPPQHPPQPTAVLLPTIYCGLFENSPVVPPNQATPLIRNAPAPGFPGTRKEILLFRPIRQRENPAPPPAQGATSPPAQAVALSGQGNSPHSPRCASRAKQTSLSAK